MDGLIKFPTIYVGCSTTTISSNRVEIDTVREGEK